MKATRINESEAIFERFMDPARSGFPRWRFACDSGTEGKAEQNWCSVKVSWQRGRGGIVGKLDRRLDLELEDYDELMIRMSLPSTASVSLYATVDGAAVCPVSVQPGMNDYVEYTGPVSGRALSELAIEIRDSSEDPGVSMISWIGLCNTAGRDTMLERSNPYPEAWADMVEPGPRNPEPLLGLFFDTLDLPELRAKIQSELYKPLSDPLRSMARSFIGTKPWNGITREYNLGNPIYGRDRDPSHIDVRAMRLCAFFGLIDEDDVLLRTAIDHALAAVHCEYWADGPIMTLPGTTHEHRAFVAYRTAVNVAFALDWAGSLLTDTGRDAVVHALMMKGLPWCLMSLMKHDYMRGCNQGVYMAYGAVIIESVLAGLWKPHGGELIEQAKVAIDETVERYLADDGGAFEGVGYVSSTVSHALVAYHCYARLNGLPLEQVVPEKLLKVVDYFSAMMSTAGKPGTSINVADGGRPGKILYGECLASLCTLTPDAGVSKLLKSIIPYAADVENLATPGASFILVQGPKSIEAHEVQETGFLLLPHTGQLCSRRMTESGIVRFQCIGAPGNAGHTHEDKGSIIIEACGEEILIDRGQMHYADPRSSVISHARFHNVMIPEDEDGTLCRQIIPCPEPVLPTGTGDDLSLSCRINGAPLYPDLVTEWVRTIDSSNPLIFTMIDTVRLEHDLRISLHFHSRFCWREEHGVWTTVGSRCALSVVSSAEDGTASEDFVDGLGQSVYHLTLFTAPAGEHEVSTTLTLKAL